MEPISGFVKTLGVSGLITVIMAIFYKVTEKSIISDRKKTWIVVGIGAVIGVFYMFYSAVPCTFQAVSDYFFYGLKEGLTAIGLFKVGQTIGVFSQAGK